MEPLVRTPWNGTLNWAALRAEPDLLARRLGPEGGWLVAVGAERRHAEPPRQRWSFGHVGYDRKNALERLSSRHPVEDGFPEVLWTEPRWVFGFRGDEAAVLHAPRDLPGAQHLLESLVRPSRPLRAAPLGGWTLRTPQERYLGQVEQALAHIQRGDVYELNYCTLRTTVAPGWDPFAGFARLMVANPASHAAFYRLGHHFALCASPERYLRISNGGITAQPMKGTRRRHADPVEDQRLARELATDPKERSENIMAVDVMRNDLSRVAAPRSVEVQELCAVHPHPRVHQMTSTIVARIAQGLSTWDVVRASFPMASMTGAPKVRAMELIDTLEDMRRGLFSGTLGIIGPDGGTDLNVVIRTLTYDAGSGRAGLITGSAITAASDPGQEWAECELKARSITDALGHEG